MTTHPRVLGAAPAAALDAVLIVAFAAMGRASHDEASPVLGAVGTAWPFMIGAIGGWAVVRLRSRQWPIQVGPGILVWVCTLVGGMLIRAATGQGTAPSFMVVAGLVLAGFLLGWRAIATAVTRRRR